MIDFIVGAWRLFVGFIGFMVFVVGVVIEAAKEEGAEWREARGFRKKMREK